MLTRSAEADYVKLCRLDALGLKEDASDVDNDIYQRFKDQLEINEEGWNETNIMWKQFSPALPSNKTGSLGRLRGLLRKLRKNPKLLQQYDQIIRDQLKGGIVKRVSDDKPFGKEFYLPHRPIVREATANGKEFDDFTSAAKLDIFFEKQELRTETSESKILGVSRNKVKDTFGANFQVPEQQTTKRGMLKFLASIVGIISPIALLAKDMYRDGCHLKLSWDQILPEDLMKRWTKWIKGLPHQ